MNSISTLSASSLKRQLVLKMLVALLFFRVRPRVRVGPRVLGLGPRVGYHISCSATVISVRVSQISCPLGLAEAHHNIAEFSTFWILSLWFHWLEESIHFFRFWVQINVIEAGSGWQSRHRTHRAHQRVQEPRTNTCPDVPNWQNESCWGSLHLWHVR